MTNTEFNLTVAEVKAYIARTSFGPADLADTSEPVDDASEYVAHSHHAEYGASRH